MAAPRDPRPPRETVVTGEPRNEWLEDQLRSIKSLLALVGVLALAALGVAVWALLREDDEGDGRGASPARVTRIEDRVDRLEERVSGVRSQVEDAPSADDVEQLQQDVTELQEQQAESSEAQSATAQSVDELTQRVEELARQVSEQQAQQGESP